MPPLLAGAMDLAVPSGLEFNARREGRSIDPGGKQPFPFCRWTLPLWRLSLTLTRPKKTQAYLVPAPKECNPCLGPFLPPLKQESGNSC